MTNKLGKVPKSRWTGRRSSTLMVLISCMSSFEFAVADEFGNQFEALRLKKIDDVLSEPAPADPLSVAESSFQSTAAMQFERPLDDAALTSAAAHNGPPVYRSAPKHISGLEELREPRQSQPPEPLVSRNNPIDLHVAAGHKKKKKVIIVKKKKKRKKKEKKKKKMVIVVKKKKKKQAKKGKIIIVKKKKKKKKKPVHYAKKMSMKYPVKKRVHMESRKSHAEPAEYRRPPAHHHEQHNEHHHDTGGKFYEYRAVPKPKAWEFGFKRGNEKHKSKC